MLRIAIVEDNRAAAEKLRETLEIFSAQSGERFEVCCFPDAIAFLEYYRSIYDIIFMDIELPHMNGMEAAHRLRELDQKAVLIFVTNMAQFAVHGYEVGAFDYIVKPLRYGAFEVKMRRAVALCKSSDDTIIVTQQNNLLRLYLKKVRYIEVCGHRLIFHMENGTVEGSGSLLETEKKLKGHGFLRCNKSYLVNQRHVLRVQGNTLLLSGNEELQISRLRKKEFMSELAASMGSEIVL